AVTTHLPPACLWTTVPPMSTVQEIEAAIETLSYEEQEQLAQWFEARRTPTGNEDDAPVPASHQAELDSRWADYKAGKIKRISLAELYRRASLKQ
uniref:addiction module protein n=1 Tax=Geminisphaera colitermitum TaxID=1148786 RepID=UPI0005BB3D39